MPNQVVGSIEPRWLDVLQRAGLDDLSRLADGDARDVGEPFKRKADSCVHRLELPAAPPMYLKRFAAPAVRRVARGWLRALARGPRPAGPATLEYRAVQLLRGHGFDVMEPVAHGERRIGRLWPRDGFIMAVHVPGPKIGAVLRESEGDARAAVLEALGGHLGRLHRAGFYHPLRMHDLICRDGRIDRIAMIDLDTKGWHPRLEPFSWEACAEALAVCTYLYLRCGQAPWPRDELRAFLAGYARGVGALPPRFVHDWLMRTDAKLRGHVGDHAARAVFPDATHSLADAVTRGL